MQTTSHPLVEKYLAAVARETAGLDEERRRELLADLDEHIAVALAGQEHPDDAAVRAVLARLGDPRTIAASAHGENPAGPAGAGRRGTTLPLVLLALSGVTAVVPLLSVIAAIGAIVTLRSATRWKARDRAIGTAAALVAPGLLVILGLAVVGGGLRLGEGLLITALAIPLVVTGGACAHLARAARRAV